MTPEPLFRRQREQPADQRDHGFGRYLGLRVVPAGGDDEPPAIALTLAEEAHRDDAGFRPALVAEPGPGLGRAGRHAGLDREGRQPGGRAARAQAGEETGSASWRDRGGP